MRRKIGLVAAIVVFLMAIIVNPVIAVDESQKNEEALVYGLSFGYGF